MNDESLSSSSPSSSKPTSTGEPALSSSKEELQRVTGLSKGKAWVFGDNINTDIIIPFRFKSRTNDPYEMAKYAMYGFDPDFHKKISKDDIIVAGRNFGGGSSREQAPVALKYAGISAVIAESFARIFYRNAFTIGLPALEIPEIKGKVNQGDEIKIDIVNFTAEKVRTKEIFYAKQIPQFMSQMLLEGGLIEYYKKYKQFPWTERKDF
jgi:3-isopropylmalate/(R)-2-methylmalate dehydratase small subunit